MNINGSINHINILFPGRMNSFQVAQKAFETIGFAKVATSGEEAVGMDF